MLAVLVGSDLGADAAPMEIVLQEAHRAEFPVSAIDEANSIGLGRVHGQLAILDLVPQRGDPAHPHALALGGCDLVADALAGDLALELGERQEDVEGEPPHRGRRIELLGDGDEGHVMPVEQLDDLGEVHERAGKPVDLVDHHGIDPALADIVEELLQGRPLHRAAGEAAVIVGGVHQTPALALLAPDERLARLALGVERVEVLLETLLGGFARVDGASADGRFSLGHGWP
jgi:hypothetical protein